MRAIANDNLICYIEINKQAASDDIKYYKESRSIFGYVNKKEGFLFFT